MPMKMSLIWSRTLYIGCLCPWGCFFPGSVTSTVSCSSFISSRASFSAVRRVSSVSSSSERSWFASWPICGRSSAVSLPIWRRMPVSSPFLPRYFTRRFSSESTSSVSRIACNAASRSFCIISFMRLSSKKISPRPIRNRTKACFRGTTYLRQTADGIPPGRTTPARAAGAAGERAKEGPSAAALFRRA